MASQLLAALGDADRQLTLALWVVSYASQESLAEQGLKRALGLVAQAWPTKIERLTKDACYIFSEEGYLDMVSTSSAKKRGLASDEHMYACALAVGYSYIQSVHVARFGPVSMRRVEAAHDGWPAWIDGFSRPNATTYFSGLTLLCQRALRTYLPSLLVEGSGREFGRDHIDNATGTAPTRMESTVYAATPEFLLRDCVGQLVGSRIEQLARSGCMGNGATILISHLGLERLVRVQLGERLGLNEERTIQQSAAMADAIADIFSRFKRSEPKGDKRPSGHRAPFVSRPSYANFVTAERVNSCFASIELAKSARLPFLASSLRELRFVIAELQPADKHLMYWKPARFSF